MTGGKEKIIKYLKRLKRGERCFDGFVRCASGYIGFVVNKYIVDKSLIPDAMSATFMNVVRYIQSMDEDGNPFAWLCKIAQNEAYKINNSAAARNEVALELVEDVADEHAASEKNAEIIGLYSAIDGLDEVDRKIIEYIYFDEKKYKDIAAELNITVGDITYRKKRALKKLLKLLTE